MESLKDVVIKRKGTLLLDRTHLAVALISAITAATIVGVGQTAYYTNEGTSLKLQLLKKLECRPSEIKMSNINRDGAVVVCFPEGSKKAPRSPRTPRARRRI